MTLMKLVILSLIPTYLLNINNSYTMEQVNKLPKPIRNNNNTNNLDIIKSNADYDIKIYNNNSDKNQGTYHLKSVSKDGKTNTILIPEGINMCSLVSLLHMLGITTGDCLLNYPEYYNRLLNENKTHYPDHIFEQFMTQKGIKITRNNEDVKQVLYNTSEDVTIRLRAFIKIISNMLTNKKANPIVGIIPETELQMDNPINSDMDKNAFATSIVITLHDDLFYSEEDINKIQNIFVDMDNIANIRYLYNAICYQDGPNDVFKIGDNTFELAGVTLLTYNKNGSKQYNGSHYVTAKKQSNGKWAIIDSISNISNTAMYKESGTYNDIDDIVTRLDNLNKGYILLPKLLLLRRINNKAEKQSDKILNQEVLTKINKKNDELFHILNQMDVINMLKHINNLQQPNIGNNNVNTKYKKVSNMDDVKTLVDDINRAFINYNVRWPDLEYYITNFLQNIGNNATEKSIKEYYNVLLQHCSAVYNWDAVINVLPKKGESVINNLNKLYQVLTNYYKQFHAEKTKLKQQIFCNNDQNNADNSKINNVNVIKQYNPYNYKYVKDINKIGENKINYNKKDYLSNPNSINDNKIQYNNKDKNSINTNNQNNITFNDYDMDKIKVHAGKYKPNELYIDYRNPIQYNLKRNDIKSNNYNNPKINSNENEKVIPNNKFDNNNMQNKIIKPINNIKISNNIWQKMNEQTILQLEINDIEKQIQDDYIKHIEEYYSKPAIQKQAGIHAKNSIEQLYDILKQNLIVFLNMLYTDKNKRKFVLQSNYSEINKIFHNVAWRDGKNPLIYLQYVDPTYKNTTKTLSNLQKVIDLFNKKQQLEQLEQELENELWDNYSTMQCNE